MTATGQRQAGEGEVYDVRVIAFAGGAAQTLQGLQQVFGLDPSAAQRLLDSVPVVVKHAAPANEAQSYLQLLRGIGAEVQLESSGTRARVAAGGPPPPPAPRAGAAGVPPPPPPHARSAAAASAVKPGKRPPPPAAAVDGLPRPIVRAPTQDLEFEFSSVSEADAPLPAPSAFASHADVSLPAPARQLRPLEHASGADDPLPGPSRMQSDSAVTDSRDAQGAAGRARSEFAFEGSGDGVRLELDAGTEAAVTRARTRTRAPTPATGARLSTAAPQRTQPGPASTASPSLAERVAGPPMSRAAVVDRSAPVKRDPRLRTYALLRVLGALIIGAAGVWLHHSILYGNASLLGVLVHAVAIYQLGIGLWSLRS